MNTNSNQKKWNGEEKVGAALLAPGPIRSGNLQW